MALKPKTVCESVAVQTYPRPDRWQPDDRSSRSPVLAVAVSLTLMPLGTPLTRADLEEERLHLKEAGIELDLKGGSAHPQ